MVVHRPSAVIAMLWLAVGGVAACRSPEQDVTAAADDRIVTDSSVSTTEPAMSTTIDPVQSTLVVSTDATDTETSTGSSSTATAEPTTTSTMAVSSTDPATTASVTASSSPSTTSPADAVGVANPVSDAADADQMVPLRFESRIADVSSEQFEAEAMTWLTDARSWGRAGFSFAVDPTSPYVVVLAEGPEVDELCLPLVTYSKVSCQNGPVVALNADRWRGAVDHWDSTVADYRGYLVNHEVGHLLGQRHPKPRCPVAGRPAGVMEQQTAGLEGCVGNPWPRDWEIELAAIRPVVYAPWPEWGPDPVPTNAEAESGP